MTAFLTAPATAAPNQIREWQDELNDQIRKMGLEGKVMILPFGSKAGAA